MKLDLDHSGTISVGEFLSVPELKENPLVQRVVGVLDSDLSGEVDFKGLPLLIPFFIKLNCIFECGSLVVGVLSILLAKIACMH